MKFLRISFYRCMRDEEKLMIPIVICLVSLVIVASSHCMRMHPENAGDYGFGVTMGITRASVTAISFLVIL